MQDEPNGDRKQGDGDQPVPGPHQIACLDGKNGDHEITAETGVAEEGAMFWEMTQQSAHQSEESKRDHEDRDHQVQRRHGGHPQVGMEEQMKLYGWV